MVQAIGFIFRSRIENFRSKFKKQTTATKTECESALGEQISVTTPDKAAFGYGDTKAR